MSAGKLSGRELYHRWCGSKVSDRAGYFDRMNPANQAAWERLAREVTLEPDLGADIDRVEEIVRIVVDFAEIRVASHNFIVQASDEEIRQLAVLLAEGDLAQAKALAEGRV